MVNKVITSVLVMLTIWCTCNSANSGNLLTKINEYRVEIHQFQRQVASLIDKVDAIEQREILDDIKELELPDGSTSR